MKKHVDFWKITEDSLDYAMTLHKIDKILRNGADNARKIAEPVLKQVKEIVGFVI